MRVVYCCFGLYYGFSGYVDTAFIKPSQPPALQEVLNAGIPDWLGTTARIAKFDHTD